MHALVTGDRAREFFALNDEEIARQTLEEMRWFFPAMPRSPLFARVYRWPEAICLAPGGMLKEMHDVRIAQPVAMRGLFLAGDYSARQSYRCRVTDYAVASLHGPKSGRADDLFSVCAMTAPMRSAAASSSRSPTCA